MTKIVISTCSVLPLNWLVLCLCPGGVLCSVCATHTHIHMHMHTHQQATVVFFFLSLTSRRWESACCWRLRAGHDCVFTLSPAVVKQCSVKAWISLMPLSSATKRKGTTPPISSMSLTKPSTKMQCCFSTSYLSSQPFVVLLNFYNLKQILTLPLNCFPDVSKPLTFISVISQLH